MQRHCPICIGTAFTRLGVVPFMLGEVLREHVVQGCQVCGHVMVDLRQVDAAMIAELYAFPLDDQVWSMDGALPYEDMVEFAQSALAELRARPGVPVIADFGYGQGQVLHALRDRFGVPADQLVGYDFAPLPLDGIESRSLNLDELDENSALGTPFDLAFCSHVMEHLPDPRRFLRGLRKNARTGAYLYVETPDHGLLNDEILSRSNQICPQHLHYFTVDRLASLAASCGWTVVRSEVSQFGFVPRARVLLARDGLVDAVGQTQRFLANRETLNSGLVNVLLEASSHAVTAAWGAGTDLVLAADRDKLLAQRIAAGRIMIYDRARAGASLADAIIQDSDGLARFGGTIVLTPRPAITRVSMTKVARRLEFEHRLIDPY